MVRTFAFGSILLECSCCFHSLGHCERFLVHTFTAHFECWHRVLCSFRSFPGSCTPLSAALAGSHRLPHGPYIAIDCATEDSNSRLIQHCSVHAVCWSGGPRLSQVGRSRRIR